MSSGGVLAQLDEKIRNMAISKEAQSALAELAIDPHGIEQRAAASIVASAQDMSIGEANQVLLELFGKNLILEANGDDPRLFANYERLGISETQREELIRRLEPFEDLGHPHSKRAMQSLRELFRSAEETIYLGLEVTSHEIFRTSLEQRAGSGRRTVFLMPRKAHVTDPRRQHYDEILIGWVDFLSRGPKELRDNVRLRITARAFPQLYTSALSQDLARQNVYNVGSRTTRHGSLLQVKKGTSLYELTREGYQQALRDSRPLWRIWRWEALRFWTGRIIYPSLLVLVSVILAWIAAPIATAESTVGAVVTAVATVGAAIVAGLVVEIFKRKVTSPGRLPELFVR